jgi:uncharacterized protein (DUF58 family)
MGSYVDARSHSRPSSPAAALSVSPAGRGRVRGPRFRISLTVEGWCYAVISGFILAGALARQINLLLILFGMLAGAMVMSWRLVRKMLRKLEVRRRLPESISAGDLLVVEFSAANHRRRLPCWTLEVVDTVRREPFHRREGVLEARTLLAYVPPRETRQANYRGRLMRRGSYRFGPFQVSTRFPLGLFRCRMTVYQRDTLIVYPRIGRLTHAWRRFQESTDTGTARLARRQGALEGEFYGLRDWRSGDSRRWLHWRTSARRQTPVVRQFEQRRNQNLVVVLDLGPDESNGAANPDSTAADAVERAISFVATIVADVCRGGGWWLTVFAAASECWTESGPTSIAMLHEVMRRLAVTEPAANEVLPAVLGEALDRAQAGAQLLVVSRRSLKLEDARFAELWRDARRRARRPGIRVIEAAGASLAEYLVIE